MTNEERIKIIEELGLESDKMGLIPLDFHKIFKEHTYKWIDQAVADLDKEENREKLVKCIRESSDNDMIYVKLISDIIDNCKDFHIKSFLEDLCEEKSWCLDDGILGAKLNYGSGPLNYITQYIEKPLEKIEEKYKSCYELFKEEEDVFKELWDEAEEKNDEFEEMFSELDEEEQEAYLEQHEFYEYDYDEWDDRHCMLDCAVTDLASFKKPYWEMFDSELDEDWTKPLRACSEIDKMLDKDFKKIMDINAKDFSTLVDIITETEIFKNSSVYIKNKVLKEIVKEAMKYNVNATKHEKKFAEPVEPLTIANSDLEEIKEDINIKIK